MKIIAYFEGEYNPYRGKFLNAIRRYKKDCLIGVVSYMPSNTLQNYLHEHNINLFTSLEQIKDSFTHFVITLLDFNHLTEMYNICNGIENLLAFSRNKHIRIVNGTFRYLGDYFPGYADLIWDIRKIDPEYQPEYFKDELRHKNAQLRILTVGTDSNIGKMTVGLELERVLCKKNYDVKFIATGQIGIFLKGEGISLDSTIIDFSRGMLEEHILNYDNEILIIEGQGSIFHPVFFGTATTLLNGAAPHLMIMCSRMGQKYNRTVPDWPIPVYPEAIKKTEEVARKVIPDSKIIAMTVNTSEINHDEAALFELQQLEYQLELPVSDAVRFGVDKLTLAIEKVFENKIRSVYNSTLPT
ncbi:MAG TPA: DUF1611 domain-containing protein [Patescibacteria group bacterium]|nr:DUF1611 domain-containing protein [Gammaproteobacteria bacterium]HWA51482.1 DUF1611 domain-containing protein [Patescibacteria group bacterium]